MKETPEKPHRRPVCRLSAPRGEDPKRSTRPLPLSCSATGSTRLRPGKDMFAIPPCGLALPQSLKPLLPLDRFPVGAVAAREFFLTAQSSHVDLLFKVGPGSGEGEFTAQPGPVPAGECRALWLTFPHCSFSIPLGIAVPSGRRFILRQFHRPGEGFNLLGKLAG